MLSVLLAVEDADTGERMTNKQIHDEVLTLFIAGHETTAVTLTWSLIMLSQHPDCEARLQAELAEVLGDRPPTVADLAQLPYTDYIIKETLRLYPPVPMAREALTSVDLGQLVLKKREIVFLIPYLTQRDPRYFDQPERFWPDRFAPDASGQPLERRIPRYAYFPFGGGPRVCIGNGFAMLEARLLLATIAQRFKLRLPQGHQVKIKLVPTLGFDGSVPMRIIPR